MNDNIQANRRIILTELKVTPEEKQFIKESINTQEVVNFILALDKFSVSEEMQDYITLINQLTLLRNFMKDVRKA